MHLTDTRPVPIAEIFDRNRLRPIDPAWVEALAQQIGETGGLRTPIEVRALKPSGFALIAGGHRLAAGKLLGWSDIPAQIYEATADEARLREVDENLIRHELNPLDRGAFLAERKALYLRLHPETAQHAAGGHAKAGKIAATDLVSFAEDTAQRLGWSTKTIHRAVELATNLSPESKARLGGTMIARNQTELLALSRLKPADQAAALDLYFDDTGKWPTLRAAISRVAERPMRRPDQVAKLTAAWRLADVEQRAAFLAFIAGFQLGVERFGWRLEPLAPPKAGQPDDAVHEIGGADDAAREDSHQEE